MPNTPDQANNLQLNVSGSGGLMDRFWGDADRTVATPNVRIVGQQDIVGGAYYDRFIAKVDNTANGYYNPFRRLGYLAPANATMIDVTTVDAITQTWRATLIDDVNGEVVLAGSDEIRVITTLDGVALTHNATADLGAGSIVYDFDTYEVSGTKKIVAVYAKGGTGNTLYFGSWSSKFSTAGAVTEFSIGVTVNRTAFMRVADNGNVYIFCDNNIHKYVGSTATLTANIYRFTTNSTITDAIDFRGNLVIAITRSTINTSGLVSSSQTGSIPCGVFVWNKQEDSTSVTDYIPLYGVRGVVRLYATQGGDLRAIVINAEGITEIRQYNGNTFVTISEVGRNAAPFFHDSVASFGALIVWLGMDGNIYCHGRVHFSYNEGLYKIGQLPDTASIVGSIALCGANGYSSAAGYKGYRSGLYMNYIQSGTGTMKIKQWDFYGTGASGTAGFPLSGDVYSPCILLPQLSNVKHITIYFNPTSSVSATTAGNIDLYFNQGTTSSKQVQPTITDLNRGYYRIEINKPYVTSIQLRFQFNTNVAIGKDDMSPYLAFVSYEPTTAKG